MKRFVKIAALTLLILTALNATVAGLLFIADPSGGNMGMSTAYIRTSPFQSFLVPGIVLLLVNGLCNFAAALFLIKKHPLAPLWLTVQGILLCGWIAVQVIMVQDVSPLHITMFLVGLVLTLCGGLLLRWHTKDATRLQG